MIVFSPGISIMGLSGKSTHCIEIYSVNRNGGYFTGYAALGKIVEKLGL